jgi:hypothetical protein
MESAFNEKTGERLFLVNNQWVPPTQVAENEFGQKAFLVNNEWIKESKLGAPKSSVLGDLGKYVRSGATSLVTGLPEGIEAGLMQRAKDNLSGPMDIVNYLANPALLTKKIASTLVPGVPLDNRASPSGLLDALLSVKDRQLTDEYRNKLTAQTERELMPTKEVGLKVDELITKGKYPGFRDLAIWGQEKAAKIEKNISPEMRQRFALSTPTGDLMKAIETGDYSDLSLGKDPSLLGYTAQGAKVLGSVLPLLTAALVTKSTKVGAGLGFAGAAGEGKSNARDYINGMNDEELSKKSEYFRNLIAMGTHPKLARRMTEDKAGDLAAFTQGIVGAFGGAFTTKLLTGKLDDVIPTVQNKMARGFLDNKIVQGLTQNKVARGSGRFMAGVSEEAATEFAEGIASDLGINKTVVKEIGTDSFANLVLGALGGVGSGGISAFTGGKSKKEADLTGYTPTGEESTNAPIVGKQTITIDGKKTIKVTREDGTVEIDGVPVKVEPKETKTTEQSKDTMVSDTDLEGSDSTATPLIRLLTPEEQAKIDDLEAKRETLKKELDSLDIKIPEQRDRSNQIYAELNSLYDQSNAIYDATKTKPPETTGGASVPASKPKEKSVDEQGTTFQAPVYDENGKKTKETDPVDLNPDALYFEDGEVYISGTGYDHNIDSIIDDIPDSPIKQQLIAKANELKNSAKEVKPVETAKTPEILFAIPAGENTEWRVFKNDSGYTTYLFDKDADTPINGSQKIWPIEQFGEEGKNKAIEYAQLEAEKSKKLNEPDESNQKREAENQINIDRLKKDLADDSSNLHIKRITEDGKKTYYAAAGDYESGNDYQVPLRLTLEELTDAEAIEKQINPNAPFQEREVLEKELLKRLRPAAERAAGIETKTEEKPPKPPAEIKPTSGPSAPVGGPSTPSGGSSTTGGPSTPAGGPSKPTKEEQAEINKARQEAQKAAAEEKARKLEEEKAKKEEEKKAKEEEKAKKEEEKKAKEEEKAKKEEEKKKTEEQKEKIKEFNSNPMKIAMETGNADAVASLLYGHAVDESMLPVIFPEEMLLRIPVDSKLVEEIEEALTKNKFRITDRSVPATTDDPSYTGPAKITISALYNPEKVSIQGGGAEFFNNRKGQITTPSLPKDPTEKEIDALITKLLDLAKPDKIFDIQSNPDNTFGAMMFKEGLVSKVISPGDYIYELIKLPERRGGQFNTYIPASAGNRQAIKLVLAEGKEELVRKLLGDYVTTLNNLQTILNEHSSVTPLYDALQSKYIKDTNGNQLSDIYTTEGLDLRTKFEQSVRPYTYFTELYNLFRSDENSTDQTNRIVKKDAEVPPELGNIIRRGMRDHRQGRDVDIQDFLETFKFLPGGIDFGNWVNQSERAAHLNSIYDAMYDLSDITGVSPKILGLGEKLKLAVGAQGRGGKTAAHYVPGANEINLTKTKGDGSLGHEWQHALDWNLSRTPKGKMLMTQTADALIQSMTVERAESNLRAILTNTANSENNRNTPPKKAFFNAITNRKYSEAPIYDESSRYTQYYKDARELDTDKDKKYWSTPVELLSRAFESLIFDLSKGGSPYLVGPTVADGYVTKKNGYAGTSYPAGKERPQINEIYQQMLDQIDPDTLEIKTYKLENQIIAVEELGYAVVDQYYLDHGPNGGLDWYKTEAEAQKVKEQRDGTEAILTPKLLQISKVNQHIINMAQRIDAIMEEMGLFKWPEIKNGSMAESMFYHMRQGWWPENNRQLAEYGIKAYLQAPELLGFNPLKDQKEIDNYKIADFEGDRVKLKQTQEDFEAAATRYISQIITDMRSAGSDTKAIYDYIVDKYNNQPTLDVRSVLSVTNNAYSTPLPIGFIAGALSRVKSTTTVLDPTGGNGMLVVAANPKNVTTIELDQHRANNLRLMQMGNVIEGDALVKIKDIQDQQVDVVLTNPPFGALPSPVDVMSWTGQNYKIGALDQLIAAESLRTMANDGRAVLILGSHIKPNTITSTDRVFLNWLYGNYNVADHFEIAGNLYRKQGASFPLRVLVIAGRNQTDNVYPNDFVVNRLTSFDELWSRYVQAFDRSEQVVVGAGRKRTTTGGADRPTGAVPTSDSFEDGETSTGDRAGTSAGSGEPVSPTGGVNVPPKSRGRGTTGGVRDTEQQQDSGEDTSGESGSGATSTTGRGKVSGGESGVELGGLSDLDLDDIFDNLGKKPKVGPSAPRGTPKTGGTPRSPRTTKAKGPVEIPDDLKGLGLEDLLDELDAALNGTAPEITNKEPTQADSQERLDKQAQEAMDRIAQNTKNTSDDPNSGLYSRKGDQDYANVQPIIQKVWDAVGQKVKDAKEHIVKVYDLLVKRFGDAIKNHLRTFVDGLRTTVKKRPKNQTPIQGEPIDTESRVVYLGKSRFSSDGIYLPRAQSQYAYTALENLEAQVGNIDEFVAKELGYSSIEQMAKGLAGYQIDALALAIQANKLGKGFIIGDDTGVGKGRTAAAMIVWAKKQGKVPVFVSLSDSLYTAMYKDLTDIGHGDIKIAMTNAGAKIIKDVGGGRNETVFQNKKNDDTKLTSYIIKNNKLPPGIDAVFTNYSQLNGGAGSGARQSAIATLVASGNAVLIMDEAHNAAGTQSKKESMGQNAFFMSLLTGKNLLGIGEDAPDSWQPPPTVYLSATFAKRPDNMPVYIHTNLRYAADTPEELTALFGKGVKTDVLQQVSSEMLVESGSMIRRERSYEGVNMDFIVDEKNTARDTREVDKVTEILRALVNADRALKEWLKTPEGIEAVIKLGPPGSYLGAVGPTAFTQAQTNTFTSVVHNYIGSLLLSTKTQTAVDMVVDKLNNNEKVVVGLQNTNGSALEDFVAQNNIKKGDDIPDFGWQTLIKRAVKSTTKVTLKSATGDKAMDQIVYVPYDVMPKSIRAGYSNVEDMLEDFQSNLPASPIDFIRTELERKYTWMIDDKVHVGDTPPKGVKARHLVVKEITGRTNGIDYSGDIPKFITLDNPERTSMISSYQNGDESQDGPIDVLVINSAGATGISLHASVDAFDQRPRHMIVLQPHGDISVFIQLLGRIHRNGQVEWPSFTMLASGIPAERRILAMLRKKLSSLKSNTSGGSNSTQVEGVDFINMYGDVSTAEYLNEHPDIQAFLNTKQYPDPAEAAGTDLAHKASGTAGLLSSVDQKEFFDSIEASYTAEIELRNATGTNALARRSLPLQAEIIKENLIEEGLDSSNPFLSDVVMAQFNVDIIGSIPTVQNIKDDLEQGLNGRTAQDVVDDIEKDLSSVYIEVRNQIILKQQAVDEAIRNPNATEKDIAELNKQKTALDTQFATLNDRKDKTLTALKTTYAIGNGFDSFEVNSVPASAVIVGIKVDKARIGKSKTGNPYSPSNFQVIIRRNIPEGRVSPTLATLEGNTMQHSSPTRFPVLEDMFALKSVTGGRTTRYIALGNILKAAVLFSEDGGEIAKFTLSQGGEEITGVVMPAKYAPGAISAQPVRLRNQESAVQYFLAVWDAVVQKRYEDTQIESYKEISDRLRPLMIPNLPSYADMVKDIFINYGNAVVLRGAAEMWQLRLDLSRPNSFRVTIAGDVPKPFITSPILKTLVGNLAKKGGKWEMEGGTSLTDPEKLVALIKYLHKKYPATVSADNATFARDLMKVEFDYSESKKGLASRSVAEGGQSVEAVESQIIPIKGITVKVLQSVSELPDNTAPSDVEGMWLSGRNVYLIADNLPNAKRVQEVLAHEAVGHALLEEMLGPKLMAELIKNVQSLEKTSARVKQIAARVDQTQPGLSADRRAKEIVANMAERGMYKIGLIQRVIQAIRNWLRGQGFTIKFSDGDIVELLNAASKYGTDRKTSFPSLGAPKTQAEINRERQAQKRAGTAGYYSRNADSQKFKATDELLKKHNRPDAPIKMSNTNVDKLLGGVQEAKEVSQKLIKEPKMAVNNMVGSLDRGLLTFRVNNTDYTAGLTAADSVRYGRDLADSQGRAVASVAMNQVLKAARIGTQVVLQGKMIFDPATQLFRAVKDKFSMANIIKLKHDLEKEIGQQRAANVIQAYFEAKRSKSIVQEYADREANLEMYLQERDDPNTSPERQLTLLTLIGNAQDDLKNIGIALQKVRMTEDAIQEFIALEKEYPQLKKMMENWNSVNKNMINMMEQSRIISADRAKVLREIEDYVPWQRIQDDQTDPHAPIYTTRGVRNVSREHRFREGVVTLDIDDIVDNMIHNVMVTTRNSIKNYAANRIAQEYATRNENGKIKVFPKEDFDRGIVTIMVNGRKINVQIADPLIAQSVIGMENVQIPMGEILAFFSNTLRRSITWSPIFQAKQLFMDAPTAALVIGVKNPVALYANVFGSFLKGLTQNDGIIETLKAHGIGGYHSTARTAESEYRQEIGLLNQSLMAKASKFLDQIGDASDYAQRRAVYKQVMKETNGDQRAAILAASNVINFDKRGAGRTAQALNRTLAFMNAFSQQLDVLLQAVAEPVAFGVEKVTGAKVSSVSGNLRGISRTTAMSRVVVTAGLLTTTCLVYAMLLGDDDEYLKMDDQTKMRNFIIPKSVTGLDNAILFPMHTSASYFFKAIPEMLYLQMTKEGTKEAVDTSRLRKALKEGFIDAMLGPLSSGPIPTGIKPVAEIALNYNFFTGGDVVPKGLEKLDPSQQYRGATSELGKWFSQASFRLLNPIEADHLMRGLFGSVASIAMWGSNLVSTNRPEPEARSNLLYGSFIAPDMPRGREDLFYDLKDKSETAMRTYKKLMKDGYPEEGKKWLAENKNLINVYDFTQSASSEINALNAEIYRTEALPAAKMGSEEKRNRINFLKGKKAVILENTMKFRQKALSQQSP